MWFSPYLSQFIGLFSLGHGGPGGERLLGLGHDAGTHVVCYLLCFFEGRYFLLERLRSNVLQNWRPSYLCEFDASEGREHKPSRWGSDTGGGGRGLPLGDEWIYCLDHLVPLGPRVFLWYVEFHNGAVLDCVICKTLTFI